MKEEIKIEDKLIVEDIIVDPKYKDIIVKDTIKDLELRLNSLQVNRDKLFSQLQVIDETINSIKEVIYPLREFYVVKYPIKTKIVNTDNNSTGDIIQRLRTQ